MNLEERVQIAILSKYYGKILTERQQSILNMYVDNQLSHLVIADKRLIRRNNEKYSV